MPQQHYSWWKAVPLLGGAVIVVVDEVVEVVDVEVVGVDLVVDGILTVAG